MIWAMLSTSPLGTTTFSDTDVNLLGGGVDYVGGVGRMLFIYGLSVPPHETLGVQFCKGSYHMVYISAQQVPQ